MKLSRYNFLYENFLPDTDKAVIYNSRTGALSILEPENCVSFKDFSDKGVPIKDLEFEKQLRDCGYIIEDDFDEIKQIKLGILTRRFDNSTLGITIALTMDCNFRCIYCYEKGHQEGHQEGHNHTQFISDEVIDKIVEIVRSKARGLANLYVMWYGGEPLLAIAQLEKASKKLMDVCAEFDVEYSSTITTNGYLLTADIATRLKDCKVGRAQISIDGSKTIHDKRRPLSDGRGTFDEIIKNLSLVIDNISVILRVNVDKENEKSLSDVVGILRERNLMEHITPFIGRVTPYNEQYDTSKCLSLDEYSKVNLQFMLDNDIPLGGIRPIQKANFCMADCSESLVIDPRGNIYKCTVDVGRNERIVSTVYDNRILNAPLLHEYLLYDSTMDTLCSECKYLPVCIGGCPRQRLEGFDVCTEYKYILSDFLSSYVKVLMSENA